MFTIVCRQLKTKQHNYMLYRVLIYLDGKEILNIHPRYTDEDYMECAYVNLLFSEYADKVPDTLRDFIKRDKFIRTFVERKSDL